MTASIPGFQRVGHDVAIGGQPSSDRLAQLKQEGFLSIVNLRPTFEQAGFDEQAEAIRGGLNYFHIPIVDADSLTPGAVNVLDGILADPVNLPVVVHCGSGNRVGALFALRAAWLKGADLHEALRIGRDHGLTRLEDDVRRILST